MIAYEAETYLFSGIFKIPTYGLTLTLAFFIVCWYALSSARSRGIQTKDMAYFLLVSALGALFFSRFHHMLIWHEYDILCLSGVNCLWWQTFVNWSHTGMASFGGVYGAFLGAFLYSKFKRVSILRFGDLVGLGFGLGWFIGRIGCFFVPDDFGFATNFFLAMDFGDGILRHPAQIYDMINGIIVFLVTQRYKFKLNFDGFTLFLATGLYSFIRFLIQFLRDDPEFLFGFSSSHFFYGGYALIAFGYIGYKYVTLKKPKKSLHS